jgi:8-oxo-(d)GTP phosphatase
VAAFRSVAPGSVLLLRHGWAGDRDRFAGDDRERPLDERGRAQAAALPEHLLSYAIDDPVLVSSPYLRCTATLEPLATALGTSVATADELAEVPSPLPSEDGWPDAAWLGTRAVRAVDAAVARAGGRPVVACSHGEILPAALAVLAARHGLAVPDHLDLTRKALPKGAGWLVEPAADGGRFTLVPAPDHRTG